MFPFPVVLSLENVSGMADGGLKTILKESGFSLLPEEEPEVELICLLKYVPV